MLKLLAFDLDDTLYPESEYVRGGFRTVSTYMQKKHKIDANEFYKKLISTKNLSPSAKVFDIVLENYQLKDRKLVEKLIKLYRSQTLKLKLFPGIRSMLKKFKKKYILALVTDGKKVVQDRKLNYLRILDYFDTIFYTLDLGNNFKKPSEQPFKQLLHAYRIKPQEALYIGNDPNKDFIGAKKAGIRTIRVNQGFYKDKAKGEVNDADFTIGSIKELPSLIMKIENPTVAHQLNQKSKTY